MWLTSTMRSPSLEVSPDCKNKRNVVDRNTLDMRIYLDMCSLQRPLDTKTQLRIADYFCTCDDRFLKRAKSADTLQTKVVSPIDLVGEAAR